MQLITSQLQFSKTVLRHLHRITWSAHSTCGVLAAALESGFVGVESEKPPVQGDPQVSHMHGELRVAQSAFPLHHLPHSAVKLLLPQFFQVFIQQIFIAQVLWARNFTGRWRNTRQKCSLETQGPILSEKTTTRSFTSNCSTAIWQVLLRRNGRFYTQRHWHPRSSKRSSGKGWRQEWEAWVGNRVPERAFQAVGPEPQPCGRKNHGKAAGGSLRLRKDQAMLTCSVVDSGFYPEDSEDQVESFKCACLSVSSAAMQAEWEQGRQSSGRLREGATQWWWDRMGAVPQKQNSQGKASNHIRWRQCPARYKDLNISNTWLY